MGVLGVFGVFGVFGFVGVVGVVGVEEFDESDEVDDGVVVCGGGVGGVGGVFGVFEVGGFVGVVGVEEFAESDEVDDGVGVGGGDGDGGVGCGRCSGTRTLKLELAQNSVYLGPQHVEKRTNNTNTSGHDNVSLGMKSGSGEVCCSWNQLSSSVETVAIKAMETAQNCFSSPNSSSRFID